MPETLRICQPLWQKYQDFTGIAEGGDGHA